MPIDIKQSNIFNFSSTVGQTTYNFSIPADSKESACKTLIEALSTIIKELDAHAKSTTKSN